MTAGGPVVQLDPLADARWDEYVRGHPRATAYHLGAWAHVASAAYGYRPRYLAIADGDRLRGAIPLFLGRGLSGRRLTSMPIVRMAGPIGDGREEEDALLGAVRARLAADGARTAIVRSTRPGAPPGWSLAVDQPGWVLSLPSDPDELRARLRRRSENVHRGIRRAESAGVSVREGGSDADLRAFYDLYLRTMRRHRALPRSLRQLQEARARLGGVFRLFLAETGGAPAAGGVFLAFNGTLELLYNASDEERLDLRPNHALYWQTMVWAIERGLDGFDFGGAMPGTSLATFKSRWGAEPVPVYRLTAPAAGGGAGEAAPVPNRNVVGRDGSLLARAWERAPLALTRLGGALAYRWA